MLRGDLHIHTNASRDSNLTPLKVLEAAKRKNLDVVAITNHNTIRDAKETEKLGGKFFPELIVIVGEEVKTKQGEIIALNIEKNIPNGLDVVKTCEMVKEQNGLVILPHPFDVLRSGLGKKSREILKFVDAVEGFNARSLFKRFNEKGVEFAREYKLPLVAGSDAHFVEEIGQAITLIDSEPDKGSVIKAIKSGRTEITGRKSGTKPHVKTFFQKFR